MRLLGIDYGSKRVGIAISDEGKQFALPYIVLNNSEKLLEQVLDIVKEKEIGEIVIGESKNYKGEENKIFGESLQFKESLESKNYKVHFEPEFMTSANAERFQGKNHLLDASAAALILQSFLDRHRIKNNID